MVTLRVDKILEKKGKSVYWLYVNYFPSMGYTNLNNIIKNKTQRISYQTIDILSEALEVPISELFEKKKEKIS